MKNLKMIALSLMIVLVTVFSVLLDFMSISYSSSLFTDVSYWANVFSVQIAVIMIIFVARSLAKDREMKTNGEYAALTASLHQIYADLSARRLNTAFKEYIAADNRARKLQAYTGRINRKLRWCKRCLSRKENRVRRRLVKKRIREEITVSEQLSRVGKRIRERIAELQDLLEHAEADIEYLRVRVVKVNYSVIFGDIREKKEEEADLYTHESRSIVGLLLTKIAGIFAFGVIATSFVVFDTKAYALAVVYKAIVKVVQIIFGIYTGYVAGQTFVRGDLCGKLRKRLDYVRVFNESRAKEG